MLNSPFKTPAVVLTNSQQQHTLSMCPVITPCQYTLSTHPVNTPFSRTSDPSTIYFLIAAVLHCVVLCTAPTRSHAPSRSPYTLSILLTLFHYLPSDYLIATVLHCVALHYIVLHCPQPPPKATRLVAVQPSTPVPIRPMSHPGAPPPYPPTR